MSVAERRGGVFRKESGRDIPGREQCVRKARCGGEHITLRGMCQRPGRVVSSREGSV